MIPVSWIILWSIIKMYLNIYHAQTDSYLITPHYIMLLFLSFVVSMWTSKDSCLQTSVSNFLFIAHTGWENHTFMDFFCSTEIVTWEKTTTNASIPHTVFLPHRLFFFFTLCIFDTSVVSADIKDTRIVSYSSSFLSSAHMHSHNHT